MTPTQTLVPPTFGSRYDTETGQYESPYQSVFDYPEDEVGGVFTDGAVLVDPKTGWEYCLVFYG